jgi:tripartite-type tricarboxylate transporter receptor subunit TctC
MFAAQAQPWPTKSIRLIVPHAPGGVTDVVARMVSQPGTEVAAKTLPDGYTLLMYVDTNAIFPSTVKQLNHDPLGSFDPVTIMGRGSHVLVAHPSLGVTNLAELEAYLKAHPRELSYASPGTGSPQHLDMEIIRNAYGMDLVHIPYKGGGQAIIDIVSGQVKLGMLGMAPALPHIKSGKLNAIAVTGRSRSVALPQIRTVAESGLIGFETGQGLVVPSGTPPLIAERLHTEIVKVMQRADIKERLQTIGMDNSTSPSPAAFRTMLKDEVGKWATVVKASGIQPE